ncbi:MAG: hypothetical protein NTZ17_10265 [Phycisphaerae bacterium]|nr:hypothetical protein [Phycisphaerae bacterium]
MRTMIGCEMTRLWIIGRATCLYTVPAVLMLAAGACSYAADATGNLQAWQEKIVNAVWVAYSPPSANPQKGMEATVDAIRQDLSILHDAKFTGLVTYGSSGVMGKEFPQIARQAGFKGLIMGVWDPNNQQEMAAAVSAAKNPIILGYCVGNEGLGKRYNVRDLSKAIDALRKATGKRVTTTEEIDDYTDEELLGLGDWIYPNAHPYFHSQLEPKAAIDWTVAAFQDLTRRGKRFVMFKEVGLPTAGDPAGKMSEAAQDTYYVELAKTPVKFVYFEAFDQPWKTHLPIEPHWGIFNSDRSPKVLAKRLLPPVPLQAAPDERFYVYEDADSSKNHFKPTGFMGDTGDIHIDEACEVKPHSGQTCIRILYDAKGKGPSTAPYPGAAKWAGVYWQEPPNNWGKDEVWKDSGFNLSPYKRMVFWARAEKDCRVEFKVGGISEKHGDSLKYPRGRTAKLTTEWKEYDIDLRGTDLARIIGGFCWATNWDTNPDGITFYLDDIRYEKN